MFCSAREDLPIPVCCGDKTWRQGVVHSSWTARDGTTTLIDVGVFVCRVCRCRHARPEKYTMKHCGSVVLNGDGMGVC